MEQGPDLLSKDDLDEFKSWLNLNLNNISWEGRYLNEFEVFWDSLFSVGVSVEEQVLKIQSLSCEVKEGPLVSWLKWLSEKFLCFLFLRKEKKLSRLSEIFNLSSSEVAFLLRHFFVSSYPELEDFFNEKFQIGNKLSLGHNLVFSDILEALPSEVVDGGVVEEIMPNLEITLYAEWSILKNFSFKDKNSRENSGQKDKEVSKKRILSFNGQLKFLSELILLFSIGALLIFVIKVGNKWYEDYLVDKISLFEPNFFWLDKNLSFTAENNLGKEAFDIRLNEIEKLEDLNSKKLFFEEKSDKRYDVESDVILTSVDSLPRNFTSVGFEQSTYEERKKGGYRNNRYGRRRAYRVMMTSVDTDIAKNKLKQVLKKYKFQQVDNVKPGTEIPGGVYFNVYLPTHRLKDFFLEVSSVEETTILESSTIFGGPKGTSRIFIWVKKI